MSSMFAHLPTLRSPDNMPSGQGRSGSSWNHSIIKTAEGWNMAQRLTFDSTAQCLHQF